MNIMRPAIPLTILSGFLGAGKTTLLNNVLKNNHGLRIAVVVNDFGSINIDQQMIVAQDGETISLANGCVCCSIGDSLMMTLLELLQRPQRPDHLIIEASGVSDPWKIAQIGLSNDAFKLDGIITLADAELVSEQVNDKYVGETVLRQLSAADLIVLNKLDLVSREQTGMLHKWLGGMAPEAHVIESVHANVPPSLLLGINGGRIGAHIAQKLPYTATFDGTQHSHRDDYITWNFTSDRPFRSSALREALNTLPRTVMRAKGILYVEDYPECRTKFQLVGKRWDISPGLPWDDVIPNSQLVLIGLKSTVERAFLLQKFQAALAPA